MGWTGMGMANMGMASLQAWLTGVALAALSAGHCAAMCGPLCHAMCGTQSRNGLSAYPLWAYQTGRVVGYGSLGALVGWTGKRLLDHTPPWTSWVAAAIAGLVIIAAGCRLWQHTFADPKKNEDSVAGAPTPHPPKPVQLRLPRSPNPSQNRRTLHGRRFRWATAVPRALNSLRQKPGGLFLVGIATLILPCGVLWIAAAHAAVQGHPLLGALAMVGFALGSAVPQIAVHLLLPRLLPGLALRSPWIPRVLGTSMILVGFLFVGHPWLHLQHAQSGIHSVHNMGAPCIVPEQ